MFTRMIVCEVLTDENVKHIVSRMQEHVRNIPDLIGHSILAEEGGRMVILTTDWSQPRGVPASPCQQVEPPVCCRARRTCWSEVTS